MGEEKKANALEKNDFTGSLQGSGNKKEQTLKKVSDIANSVLNELSSNEMPPLPENFEAYFDKVTDVGDTTFREQIKKILNLHAETRQKLLDFELGLKHGMKDIKDVLELTKSIFKNLILSNTLTKQKLEELSDIDNQVNLKQNLNLFLKDLEEIQTSSQAQINEMKEIFNKASSSIQMLGKNTIFDANYMVYNKTYFLSLFERKKEVFNQLGYDWILVGITLSHDFLSKVKDKDSVILYLKAISDILSRNTKSNEILSYFGNGKFLLLLKYIDLENATERVKFLLKQIKDSNMCLMGQTTTLDVCAGISQIDENKSSKESIQDCLNALDNAIKNNLEYTVLAISKEN